MWLLLTLAVFLIDLLALVSIFGTRLPFTTRLLWTAVVLALPLAGAAVWWRAGSKRHLRSERA